MLKRSSRVIPGFLGTPAGMITTSAPSKAFPNSASLAYPTTYKQASKQTPKVNEEWVFRGGGGGGVVVKAETFSAIKSTTTL